MHFEVAIIGAGISAAALCYELSRYTNIKKIAIIEKYGMIAPLNSKASNNSQTIHFGDIETNYTLKKAMITKRTAKMIERYCLGHNYQNKVIFKTQKMALGVGEEEVEFILERYEEFIELFPYLEIFDKERLKEIEPAVVYDSNNKERKEPIIAIGSLNEWSTVDYGKMAETLIENAKKEPNKEIELYLNNEVKEIIQKDSGGFYIKTPNLTLYADFVVVNAGAHSLFLAHKMEYGLDLGCLPIAGSFYLSKKKILNGKVYMVQNPKLPFAALHGDPDILANGNTRFGPTALILPRLERYTNAPISDFLKTLRFDKNIASIFWDLISDSDIRAYMIKNILFELPLINKALFIKDARKIVPSLKEEDLYYAKGFGGVRPQVLDKKAKKLMLGEASINPKNGIIFNMTPSPGATSALGNGERDMRFIVEFLGKNFDEARFIEELIEPDCCILKEPIRAQKEYASKLRAKIHEHEEYYYGADSGLPKYWDELYNPWKMDRKHWSL